MAAPWHNDHRPGRHSFPKPVARAILKRDGECTLRISPACTGEAEEADHIVSHADATRAGWAPEDIDDMGNGRAVCAPCHRILSQAQAQAGAQRKRAQGKRPTPPHPGLL